MNILFFNSLFKREAKQCIQKQEYRQEIKLSPDILSLGLTALAKQIMFDLERLRINLANSHGHVTTESKVQIKMIGLKANRAMKLKREESNTKLPPTFFLSIRSTATMIEEQTGVRFNLDF